MVTVAIVPAPEQRVFTNVPVRVRNLGLALTARVTPPTISVRVRGTKETISKLRDTSIVAYVDLEGVGEGDYGLPVRIGPAPDVGIDQLDPTMVNIHVQ
jgi:hypothetical protein